MTQKDGFLETEIIRLADELAGALYAYLTQRLGLELSIKDGKFSIHSGDGGQQPIPDQMHNLITAMVPGLTKIVKTMQETGEVLLPCVLCRAAHTAGLDYGHEFAR